MSSDEEWDAINDTLLKIIKVQVQELRRNNRKKRSTWVRKWISRRERYGATNTLLRELAEEDPTSYFNYLRINEKMFQWLLEKVAPKIHRQNTLLREAIPAISKLHVTLRFLAAGDSLSSLAYSFRIPKCTISEFIPETLDAIYDACKEFLQVPKSEAEWKNVVDGFFHKWNFPSCIGALDGKHITIRCPPKSGSNYYNYKGTFSIVLLGLVDDDYNFICIDVGSYGSMSDGGVFNNSRLKYVVENDKLNIPAGSVIVGDEGFPLTTYLMKPYARRVQLTRYEKIFNYRLSRARRIVENAFGILVSRFRIFARSIHMEPNNVPKLVRTACALHNWIRKSGGRNVRGNPITVDIEDTESGKIIDGSWRNDVATLDATQNLAAANQRNPAEAAKQKRIQFTNYFNNEGAVPWQDRMID